MPEQLTTYQKARFQVVAYRNFQALAAEVLAPYGINTSQWVILGWLHDYPDGMRVTSLADVLQVETPLVTSLTQPLEASGRLQIKVDTADKRARLLTLTDDGEQLIAEIEPQLAERLRLIEKGFRQKSIASYYTALEKFIANYKKRAR